MSWIDIQKVAVDAIKRDALVRTSGSPRAEAYVLTEYLWSEECAESPALVRGSAGPPWVGKLIASQLADERRHAALLRSRLEALGIATKPPPALARAKLWWLERACRPFLDGFEAGPVVVVLAIAAQLEATGVRMFGRHLAVLDQLDPRGPTAEVVRSILGDEQRHARSCAAAADKLVQPGERERFMELARIVARIDRAFGITIAVRYWLQLAVLALRDRREVV
jgi:hypothetical protein